MDPLTGDFGGEFRLAEISDENGKRIVTGGTVTGNILKMQIKSDIPVNTLKKDYMLVLQL